jgi:hypothetical protein
MGPLRRIWHWLTAADRITPAECCRRGHAMSDDNAYIRPDGRGRECRTCRREAAARRRNKSNQPDHGHNI